MAGEIPEEPDAPSRGTGTKAPPKGAGSPPKKPAGAPSGSAASGAPPFGGSLERWLISIQVSGAVRLLPYAPTTSTVMTARAQASSRALIKAAQRAPAVYKALEGLRSGWDLGSALLLPASLAVALAIDLGRLRPRSRIAVMLIGPEVDDLIKGGVIVDRPPTVEQPPIPEPDILGRP